MKAIVKKDVKSKVAAKKWLDCRLMVKILMMIIHVNCQILVKRGKGNTNSPELLLFAISLQSRSSLGRHLGFHIFFFYNGLHTFFTAGLFWIRLLLLFRNTKNILKTVLLKKIPLEVTFVRKPSSVILQMTMTTTTVILQRVRQLLKWFVVQLNQKTKNLQINSLFNNLNQQ